MDVFICSASISGIAISGRRIVPSKLGDGLVKVHLNPQLFFSLIARLIVSWLKHFFWLLSETFSCSLPSSKVPEVVTVFGQRSYCQHSVQTQTFTELLGNPCFSWLSVLHDKKE